MHKISPPWTLTELVNEISVDLARAPTNKEVSSASRPHDRPPMQLGPNTKCSNCGAVGKHLSKECPINCNQCSNNYCQGARGMLCCIACDIQLSKRNLMSAIEGVPMHPYIVSKLDKQWAAKHAKELSMVEMAVAAVEGNDENEEPNVPGCDGLINPI